MKKILTIIAFIAIGLLLVGYATAATPGDAAVSSSANRGEYSMSSSDTVSVEAGNITYAALASNMSTYRWAGLLGSVSGNIILGDSGNHQLFNWSASAVEVYASTASSITWSSLADATNSDMATLASYLTSGSDNYSATFTGGVQGIGSNIFSSLTSDYATTLSTGATTWQTYSLKSGSDLVWAGKVVSDGTGFDGSLYDYQMILPEDGTAGNTAATSYNLWVELQ